MKKIILIITFLFSSLLHAFPNVGDTVYFTASLDGEKYEYKRTVFDYVKEDDSFIVNEIIYKGDNSISFVSVNLPRYWFYNEEKVQNVLNNCTMRGGALGLELVGNKKVKTCSFYDESSQMDYSIGMVPFGQVRFQYYLKKNTFLDFQLQDFNVL